MRIRTFSFLALLALIVAACGGGVAEDTTTTVDEQATTTTSQPEVSETPDAVRLAYNLEPGTSFEYEVDIDQSIEMSAEGNGAALGDEEIPGELSVNLVGTTTFGHSVAEGPEPGTFEVTITGDFTDLEITGVIDGEPIDTGDIPEFAELEPIDVTVIVDEQGNIITDHGEDFGDLFGGDLGGFGSFGDMSGMDPGRFVGPPFTDEEVTVGDTWSETIEIPGFMGNDGITTEINSVVTDTDTVDGAEVFVVETQSVTSPIEFDLADFLIGFLTAFVPEDATAEETAEMEALMEDLRFLFNIDETVSDMTTWFDAEAGLARQATFTSATHLVMDVNMPDEESGEMMGLVMDMSIAQDVAYRLLDSDSA